MKLSFKGRKNFQLLLKARLPPPVTWKLADSEAAGS